MTRVCRSPHAVCGNAVTDALKEENSKTAQYVKQNFFFGNLLIPMGKPSLRLPQLALWRVTWP